MSLRNGMWHDLRNGIIMRNIEINKLNGAPFFRANFASTAAFHAAECGRDILEHSLSVLSTAFQFSCKENLNHWGLGLDKFCS